MILYRCETGGNVAYSTTRGTVPSVSAASIFTTMWESRDGCGMRLLCRGYLQVTAFIRAKNEIAGRVPGDFFELEK
jgi:hypothetical protein